MTLQTVSGMLYPDPNAYGQAVAGSSYQALLLDAAAEKSAYVFRAPKAGDIARVHFRTGTVTTGDALKISLQDVSPATGDPDGVADQFRTQVVANGDSNVWFRTGLVTSDGTDTGTLRTVTKGQLLSAVIEFNSFTAGNLNIATVVSQASYSKRFYNDHFTASWAKQTTVMCMAIEYSDGSFAHIPNTLPAATTGTPSIQINSSPDEIACRLRLPFNARVAGWWVSGSALAADVDVVLYDSDGTTVLASDSADKDITTGAFGTNIGFFSAPVTLLVNTFYRIALKPTTTTSTTYFFFTVNATPGAAIFDQITGGQDCYWSQRTDGGAWTDDTLKRPLIGLLLDGLEDGLSGGLSRARVVNAGGM